MILTDNETKVDLLNNEAIAKTIVGLLCDRPDQPVTIGVHGDWGAGKSSVLEMIEAALDSKGEILCLKFNGWRFQGFEDAKIALIEGIVTGLLEKRPALTKAGNVVKETFKRIDWLKVAKRAGGLALTAYTGIPSPEMISGILNTLKGFAADPQKLATKENIETVISEVGGILKPAETKNVPEEIAAFRKAFDDLLSEAKVKQLVVLIDDLDRCLPDTAIETLEAVRLFVFTAKTAFVVAADEAMIEYAVRKHFPDLPDSTGPRDYARNYLEKLIQIPFRIPALGEVETRIYVSLLLAGAEVREDSEIFKKLIPVARERLKRPWASGALDSATVQQVLGADAEKVRNALYLSEQLGSILARGSRGNPRQIKRFLNALLLRQRTADARGFGADIKLPVLAKLMLAERFIPRLFDQIAGTAATESRGICTDLEQLEAAARTEGKERSKTPVMGKAAAKHVPNLESVQPTESMMLGEWLSSTEVLSWAMVDPPLAGIDLRPYLFVTKDRKNYFGGNSVLGHLGVVVEQLFGPKLAVQSQETNLKRLSPVEAAQVLEAICERVTAGDSFDTEPAGIAGLTVLVKAHPVLQSPLLDFLERLPPGRLGPWAITGWTSVIVSAEALARFQSLQDRWKTNGGAMLKAAITVAQKTIRGNS